MTDITNSGAAVSAEPQMAGGRSSKCETPTQPVTTESEESPYQRLPDRFGLWLFRRLCKRHGCSVTIPNENQKILLIDHNHFAIEANLEFAGRFFSTIFSTDPEMIVGEGYMNGSWNVKRGSLETVLSFFWYVVSKQPFFPTIRKILNSSRFKNWQINDPSISRDNILNHYDSENFGNSLFGNMLGEVPCYSAAIFDHREQGLASAQMNKINIIVKNLAINAGDRVLDIGSGWGVLTRKLASKGCAVTGITLSQEQLHWCNLHKSSNSSASEEYRLQDYRDFFKSNTKKFDRITCIEVLDHIGAAQFGTFFRLVQENLKDDGQFFLQLITRPTRGQTSGWINKYIYPGGYVASLEEVRISYEASGLKAASVQPISGFHYAQTLKEWRALLEKNWGVISRSNLYNSEFYRKWMFFFGYSIAAFENGGFSNYHITLVKSTGPRIRFSVGKPNLLCHRNSPHGGEHE